MKHSRERIASSRSRSRGQSFVEYLVVTALAVLVLVQGGNSSPVQQVIGAMKQAYQGFAYAVGNSTNLNIF